MAYHNIAFNEDGSGTVTFILEDGVSVRTVTSSDSPDGFPRIVAALRAGQELSAADVSGLTRPVEHKVTRLDSRVTLDEDTGALTFDGTEIHSTLANTIVRYFREGRPTAGLVLFLENLSKNPSRRSREQLFDWADCQGLTVTDDGHFIGYKGVREDGTSVHSGPAKIDGTPLNGHIPNEVGSVISVDREYVQDDHTIGCSYGLHVGDYPYARSWGVRLLEVKVNPADVVSVPTNEHSKLRCCRYLVLAIHEPHVPDNIADTYEPECDEDYDFWEDDEDFDYDDDFYAPLVHHVPATFLERFKKALRLGPGEGV